jgi:hypothetical protein
MFVFPEKASAVLLDKKNIFLSLILAQGFSGKSDIIHIYSMTTKSPVLDLSFIINKILSVVASKIFIYFL